jgi:hypothetical protein
MLRAGEATKYNLDVFVSKKINLYKSIRLENEIIKLVENLIKKMKRTKP